MKYNYLTTLNEVREQSKFNTIYEAIMSDLNVFDNVKAAKTISNNELKIILEEIDKPSYVICESSGDAILLEEAIFMPEEFLITEGILDKVNEKVQKIIEYIAEGIKKVLKAASTVIKAFIDKVKENAIVKAIRAKLGLDEKFKADNFKQFVKADESIKESIDNFNTSIITEATTLSKAERELTGDDIDKRIEQYQNTIDGKTKNILKRKDGKPLSPNYCKEKIRLLKKLKAGGDANTDNKNNKSDNKTDKKVSKKPLGSITVDTEGIKNYFITIKNESISEENINKAAKGTGSAVGLDTEKLEEEQPKKKGVFNKIGNKLKDKIKEKYNKAKEWFNGQNKFVKLLIIAVLAVLACGALYFLITAVIWPVIYGLLHGGILNAIGGAFKLYGAGKTFIATYKQGKKSWESGEEWGKFFLLLATSILAIFAIGQMAAKGQALMDAANASAGAGSVSASANAAVSDNPFDLNGDGKMTSSEIMKMAKENKIPGIDLNDPKYAGPNGWQEFQWDLRENKDFKEMFSKLNHTSQRHFFNKLGMNMAGEVASDMGGKATFHGNSWFQRFIGADPSAAENAAKAM